MMRTIQEAYSIFNQNGVPVPFEKWQEDVMRYSFYCGASAAISLFVKLNDELADGLVSQDAANAIVDGLIEEIEQYK